jgi:Ca2+/H+ antiporter, TMEM165/GDT1 family
MRNFTFRRAPIFILFGIGFALLIGYAVMFLWNNALVPAISGLNTVSYWQALGIFVLSKLLFSSFGRGSGHFRHQAHKRKWMNMTDEEKRQFKEAWKDRFRKKMEGE